MKMMLKYINMKLGTAFMLGCLFLSGNLVAQKDFTLYNMNGLYQSHYVNPAFKSDTKIQIGLPVLSSTYFGVSHSGFALNDLLEVRSDDSLTFNVDNMISKLRDVNFINFDSQIDLFNFGLNVGDNFFSFSVSQRFNARVSYPKDLAVFIWEGNGKSLLGERASFDGLGFDLLAYREYAAGYSRKINEQLTVGVRAKYLQGHVNIQTKRSILGIHTDATHYDLTVDGEFQLNTAGLPSIEEGENEDFSIEDVLLGSRNSGFALDLGAEYQFSEEISFTASILDLGYIKWNSNVSNYTVDPFSFTFDGVELQSFMDDNDTLDVFEQVLDSLESITAANETNNGYRTSLFTRFYLGANYQLNENLQGGILLYNEVVRSHLRSALTLSMNAKLSHWLNATATYTMFNRSFTNLGLGLAVKGGGVQFYVITDNVIGMVAPQASRNWHVRTGINIAIGRAG
jgi:hypothetical protein